MLSGSLNRRATYDAEGNILLPQEEPVSGTTGLLPTWEKTTAAPLMKQPIREEIITWNILEEDADDIDVTDSALPAEHLADVRKLMSGMTAFTRAAVQDGLDQYRYTMSAERGKVGLRRFTDDLKNTGKRSWTFLVQPVWVPGRKKQLKQHSRGALFVFDIVRFGGTFAGIFLVLFSALNYQSFWQIASAQVNTFLQGPTLDSAELELNAAINGTETVAASMLADAKDRGDLLAFLPPVGPPENRILIPSLNLNVPLTQPSTAALLRQDWTQVETDIQTALRDGVVHYPGTARPGQAGNFFVTGHSSYYPWDSGQYKTVFARLHELQVNDEYWVYFGGDKHRYIIRSKKEVSPSDVSVLDQPGDARTATLMTCTPIGTTLRRLIVKAEEVDAITGEVLKVGERTKAAPASVPLEALPI